MRPIRAIEAEIRFTTKNPPRRPAIRPTVAILTMELWSTLMPCLTRRMSAAVVPDCCVVRRTIPSRSTSPFTMEEPRSIASLFRSPPFQSSVRRSSAPIVHSIDPNRFCWLRALLPIAIPTTRVRGRASESRSRNVKCSRRQRTRCFPFAALETKKNRYEQFFSWPKYSLYFSIIHNVFAHGVCLTPIETCGARSRLAASYTALRTDFSVNDDAKSRSLRAIIVDIPLLFFFFWVFFLSIYSRKSC